MTGRVSSDVSRAMLGACLMLAWNMAAKVTRDTLFLSVFPSSALPAMVGGSAVTAILLGLLSARLLGRHGPFRLVPAACLLSALLHLGEWLLLFWDPRVAAILIYLHVVAIGAVLLSGFWALANEQFDPREARQYFGRIAGWGTLGGLAGGLIAERVGTLLSSNALLPALFLLQLGCSAALFRFQSPGSKPREVSQETPRLTEIIARAPYLTSLAVLILVGAMSTAALDFLFKSAAVSEFGRGPSLTRFFALFYMASALITFAIQARLSRFFLDRFGLGHTVSALPISVAGAGLITLFAPGAASLTITRSLDIFIRGSLFRPGYELFYTPMPKPEKRAVKSLIDVVVDRLGEGFGAACVQLLLVFPAGMSTRMILVLVAALSGVAAWLSLRLDRSYASVLERSLLDHVVEVTPGEAQDFTTRSVILKTLTPISARKADPAPAVAAAPVGADTCLQRLSELRSRDAARVQSALEQMDAFDPILAAQVIQLLAWDRVSPTAHAALARHVSHITGQLVDCLLDSSQDFTVRRRVPKLLALCDDRRAWDGLSDALRDRRFEIRYRSARALDAILIRHPEYQPDRPAIFAVVANELSVNRSVWESRKLMDSPDADQLLVSDPHLREKVLPSIAHVFSLLGLVLPRQAVQIALGALHAGDSRLRSLALEYLDSVLPKDLRLKLYDVIKESRPPQEGGSEEESLSKLLGSQVISKL